ncbi:MAG: hypothetical protein WBG46_02985 [Nonlabens sp.]
MKLKFLLRGVLIGLPIVMICWQVYASNFMHLTRWKGGGYGMYTDSHPEYRSIVLKTGDSLTHLYPLGKEYFESLDSTIQEDYRRSRKILKFTAFFPDFYKGRFYETPYVQHFDVDAGTIEFYESFIDLDERRAYPRKFYEYE